MSTDNTPTTRTTPAAGPRMVEVTAPGRRAGDDGLVCCDDIMYQLEDGHVARRLCGDCSSADRGCGDILERQDPPEPRYRLWTGGGSLSLAPRGTFTADELRRELLADPGKGMVSREEVATALEAAIAAGSGSGSHGAFSLGSAAGSPILRWRIEEVDDLPPAEQRVADRIADLPEIEPDPGWEDRAVERAKRDGVI